MDQANLSSSLLKINRRKINNRWTVSHRVNGNEITKMEIKTRYQQLIDVLKTEIDEERIITQEAQRLAYGTDASFYRLIPQVVLRLNSLEEVVFTIKSCERRCQQISRAFPTQNRPRSSVYKHLQNWRYCCKQCQRYVLRHRAKFLSNCR